MDPETIEFTQELLCFGEEEIENEGNGDADL